jgi:hypothetical protein
MSETCRWTPDKPMPAAETSSDDRCVFCGGYHLANYKGCTVYKELQRKHTHH